MHIYVYYTTVFWCWSLVSLWQLHIISSIGGTMCKMFDMIYHVRSGPASHLNMIMWCMPPPFGLEPWGCGGLRGPCGHPVSPPRQGRLHTCRPHSSPFNCTPTIPSSVDKNSFYCSQESYVPALKCLHHDPSQMCELCVLAGKISNAWHLPFILFSFIVVMFLFLRLLFGNLFLSGTSTSSGYIHPWTLSDPTVAHFDHTW